MNKIAPIGLALLLALGAATPAMGGRASPERALALALQNAHATAEAGDPAGALEMLARFDDRQPQGGGLPLRLLQGTIALLMDRPHKAREYYRLAVELDPKSADVWSRLSSVEYRLGRPGRAAWMMEKAAGLTGSQQQAFLYRAALYYIQGGDDERALHLLEPLVADGPAVPERLETLVRLQVRRKHYEAALATLDRLLEARPENHEHWRLWAWLGQETGDEPGAVAALEVAYKLRPPSKEEWRRLSGLYYRIGARTRAAECLGKALATSERPEDLDELTGIFTAAHEIDRALKYAIRAAESFPTPGRWQIVGDLYWRGERYIDAMSAYWNAADRADDPSMLWLKTGYAAWQARQYDVAQTAFSRVLETSSPDGTAAMEARQGLEALARITEQPCSLEHNEE